MQAYPQYFGHNVIIKRNMDEGNHLCTTLMSKRYTTVGYLFQKLMFTF